MAKGSFNQLMGGVGVDGNPRHPLLIGIANLEGSEKAIVGTFRRDTNQDHAIAEKVWRHTIIQHIQQRN